MDRYKIKYGDNHISNGLKIFMALWYLYAVFILRYSIQHFRGVLNIINTAFVVVVSLIFAIALIRSIRCSIFIYHEYFTLRRMIGSKDVRYEDIVRVSRTKVRRNQTEFEQDYHIDCYGSNNKRLIRIHTSMFHHDGEQRDFIKQLQIHNPMIVLDENVQAFMNDSNETKESKNIKNDVM